MSGPVLILDCVVLETIWVLAKVYQQKPQRYLADLYAIAGFEHVVLENPLRIASALAWHADGMDFADALHLAGSEQEQCVDLKTFDIAFIKKAADRAVKVSLRHEDVGRGAPCFI